MDPVKRGKRPDLPPCVNNCGRSASGLYCLVIGDRAEPDLEFCTQACAEEWLRNGEEKLPRGQKVVKLEDL